LVIPGKILMVLSLIPLGFLVYTLFNLERLGISLADPRVIVEASLIIGFLVAGLIITF